MSTVEECLFCTTSENLYKSTVCDCKNVFFCKKCITKYYFDVNAQSCPQCMSLLNLTIGKPERVWLWNTLSYNDFINVLNSVYNYIYANINYLINNCIEICAIEPYIYTYVGFILNLRALLIAFLIRGKSNDIFIIFGIHVMYLCALVSNMYANYNTNSYLYLVQKLNSNKYLYYSLLSPQTFIVLTKINTPFMFAAVFYIPMQLTIMQLERISKHDMNTDTYNQSTLIIFINTIIILAYVKYIGGSLIGYIISRIYSIKNNKLIMKAHTIQIVILLLLVFTYFLFGIVLFDNTNKNGAKIVFLILPYLIINFFVFMEVCKFFKHDNGEEKKIFTNNDKVYYTRGIFLCEYDNKENIMETENEKNYLHMKNIYGGLIGTNICYFGKGYNGKVKLFVTCIVVPILVQLCCFFSYAIAGDIKLYSRIITASYIMWVMKIVLQIIIIPLYITIRGYINSFISQLFLLLTVETPCVVTDDNIKKI